MSPLDQNLTMPNTRSLTDAQILRAIANLDQRINYLGQNLVQLGLTVEYLFHKILEANKAKTDKGDEPLIVLDLDVEFQEFAATKAAEINEEVAAIRDQLAARKGMNLDDKDSK